MLLAWQNKSSKKISVVLKVKIFRLSYLLNRTVATIGSQKCNLHIAERLKDGLQKATQLQCSTITNRLKLGNIKKQHATLSQRLQIGKINNFSNTLISSDGKKLPSKSYYSIRILKIQLTTTDSCACTCDGASDTTLNRKTRRERTSSYFSSFFTL